MTDQAPSSLADAALKLLGALTFNTNKDGISDIDMQSEVVIEFREAIARHKAELLLSRERVRGLESLVVHCWVHSGYRNCGYDQMTTEQKALYDACANTRSDLPTVVEGLVRTGCRAADVHLDCSYPKCSCTQIPAAVKAVAAALHRKPHLSVAEEASRKDTER